MNNASRVNKKLPPGFHFEPSPQELILHYLLKKVKGLPLHPMNPIIECDLYDDEERWRNVFEQDRGRKFRYFFTKVKRKTEKSSRCNRETGYGTWKGQNQSKVYDKSLIGFDGLFTYKAKREFEGNNDNWVMHEYSLGGSMHLQGNDYVVCRVENKNEEGIVLAKHNPHPEFSNDAGINDTNRARPVASLEVQSNNIQLTETVTAMDGLLESVIATRMTTQVKEVQFLKEDASNPNPLHAQEEGKTWLNFIAR